MKNWLSLHMGKKPELFINRAVFV